MIKFKIQNSKFEINIVCCFLLLTVLNACTYGKERIYKKSTVLMDTIITISVVSDSEDNAERAIDTALSEIKRLEALFDFFAPNSEVSRVNKNAGISKVEVSPDMLSVLDKAFLVSGKTDGAFDVTIGSVTELYDFYKGVKPEKAKIQKNLSLVNYRELVIEREKSTVFLKKTGMRIDLGGISKGYAADKTVDVLKKAGIRSGFVAVAGDIRTFGVKPDGKPWKIGIRNPRAKGKDDIVATVKLKDMAISTSGDYERYFLLKGQRYHHLLSPFTGYPVHKCQSVSIIADDGVLADAFSTGVFILGPEKGIKLIEQMGFDGIIIDKDGNMHVTSNIRKKYKFERFPEESNEG